jgi:hypothetical protein
MLFSEHRASPQVFLLSLKAEDGIECVMENIDRLADPLLLILELESRKYRQSEKKTVFCNSDMKIVLRIGVLQGFAPSYCK